MARRVHFADGADEERFSLNKRIPTPRPRKSGAANRRDSTSSSSSSGSEQIAPVVRKNRSRRSKKGSRSSNSDSSRRRGIYSKRGVLPRRKQREDGRASAKERQRKSQLARSLPRRPNGKFAPISSTISKETSPNRFSTPPNRFSTPPNRFSRPPFQQHQQSDPEESFLNTPDQKLPPGRYVNDLVQTPEGQKRLEKSIVKSVEKVLAKTIERLGEGTILNFDSDSESGAEESDSNSESDSGDASFLNTTGPKLPAGKFIQRFVKTPEGQKKLKKKLMKTLNEMGGSLLNFDDDEQDRFKNPTPSGQRRSSRSRM